MLGTDLQSLINEARAVISVILVGLIVLFLETSDGASIVLRVIYIASAVASLVALKSLWL